MIKSKYTIKNKYTGNGGKKMPDMLERIRAVERHWQSAFHASDAYNDAYQNFINTFGSNQAEANYNASEHSIGATADMDAEQYKREAFLDVLVNPHRYFFAFHKTLYQVAPLPISGDDSFRYIAKIINKKRFIYLLNLFKWPAELNDGASMSLFHAMICRLEAWTKASTSPFVIYCFLYRLIYKQDIFFFIYYQNFFGLHNKTLYLRRDYGWNPYNLILTPQLMKRLFARYCLQLPPNNFLKAMLVFLRKEYIKFEQQNKSIDEPPLYSLFYNDRFLAYSKKTHSWVKFSKDKYQCLEAPLYIPGDNPILREELTQFLYDSCGGDISILNQFACLFAKCLAASPLNRLTIIPLSDQVDVQSLADHLHDILVLTINNAEPVVHLVLKTISTRKCVEDLFALGLSDGRVIFLAAGSNITEDHTNSLEKMVRGKTLTRKGYYGGNIHYKNRMHIILFENNERNIVKISNLVKADIVDFHRLADPKTLNGQDGEWLRTVFTMYGMRLLADGHSKGTATSDRHIYTMKKQKTAFQSFLDTQCELDENCEIVARDLYTAYQAYCQSCNSPTMLFKDFNKLMKMDGRFRWFRPHHTRHGSNPFAFSGITLKAHSSSDKNNILNYTAFREYLHYLSNSLSPYGVYDENDSMNLVTC